MLLVFGSGKVLGESWSLLGPLGVQTLKFGGQLGNTKVEPRDMKCVVLISVSSTFHHHPHYTLTLIVNDKITILFIFLLLCYDKSGNELDFLRSILLPSRRSTIRFDDLNISINITQSQKI